MFIHQPKCCILVYLMIMHVVLFNSHGLRFHFDYTAFVTLCGAVNLLTISIVLVLSQLQITVISRRNNRYVIKVILLFHFTM